MFGKKLFSAVASCLLAGALFVGCGSSETPAPKSDDQPKEVNVGMIAGLNVSEQTLDSIYKKIAEESDLQLTNLHYKFYDNLNALQMGLDSKSVDRISTYKSVADYMIERKPELKIAEEHPFKMPLSDKFCCAVKSGNDELLISINGAIKSMTDDGTLENLTKQYITELKGDPDAVEMPMLAGADTIKVAVTGDMPPLDLITAEGKPAGFNTAVLAEISKRIDKNFELVNLESVARASALQSGTVDVVFWVRVPQSNDKYPINFDRPDGIDISEHYFQDEIVHVGK